ncbi:MULTISPECIES: hypothetical protein [unclassified Sphingopyxis]|uniref:hypothetical protein n=1 Tax=unclassified Sphingopyxis TaxID=2614943 RepID=UPI0028668121|nr:MULTISPECIES: hypothetical protein [unclassified Sphingopyxis]MDR6833157.1 hypothetical protein [Sphingopyxis sp. BE122]MDR7228900.1 hypothetical protein [Sphingopyxis sp. BE259]
MAIPDNWFRYPDLKGRKVADSVWIPLRASEDILSVGKYGDLGYLRESFCCASLAVHLAHREEGEKLGWMDIGLIHVINSCADEKAYKAADEYWDDWPSDYTTGIELVLPQSFGLDHLAEWHLHQDFVIALGLLREGDIWVRPEEGYVEVVRLIRDEEGSPRRLEARADHLRDYLAARKMALRLVWYRDRDAIVEDTRRFDITSEEVTEERPNFRWVGRNFPIHEGSGDRIGSQTAVFHVWRTDVDPDADVPVFGDEAEDNTDYSSHTFSRGGATVYRVEGEIWAEEWIEPAEKSPRIRRDKVASSVAFIVSASGETQAADDLNNEDIGKYLWFRPDVIPDMVSRRGVKLAWYTLDTAGLELSSGYRVHFGINRIGLVTVYAYDIARLPEWQRRIWQGFNVSPEGGVSKELLDAQMKSRPAGTMAPEAHLAEALQDIDEKFAARFGVHLFRKHESRASILASIHRFRALDQHGVFALAKDISRLIVEAIDSSELQKIAPPPKGGGGTGSIKSLERVLSTLVSDDLARRSLTRLVGIYELRGADAHLPSSELEEAFKLAGIDRTLEPIEQGLQMLMRTMQALAGLHRLISSDGD